LIAEKEKLEFVTKYVRDNFYSDIDELKDTIYLEQIVDYVTNNVNCLGRGTSCSPIRFIRDIKRDVDDYANRCGMFLLSSIISDLSKITGEEFLNELPLRMLLVQIIQAEDVYHHTK
jgi:hypothetical protein